MNKSQDFEPELTRYHTNTKYLTKPSNTRNIKKISNHRYLTPEFNQIP